MRTPIIAGNWKMNKTIAEGVSLVQAIQPAAAERADVEVLVCPPFTALAAVAQAAQGGRVGVAGQDCFWKESGAYTGQVAPGMLLDAGARYVVLGHSERRGRFGVPEEGFTDEVLRHFGDSDATINKKLHAARAAGLTPIVCCGETLAERKAGDTDSVVAGQIERGLAGLDADAVGQVVLAYEPVWAIGTGETCASDEANRVCGVIRGVVGRRFGDGAAGAVRIQYGGSVKPDNAAELLAMEHIDGALVGGASLKAADFNAIIAAAPRN